MQRLERRVGACCLDPYQPPRRPHRTRPAAARDPGTAPARSRPPWSGPPPPARGIDTVLHVGFPNPLAGEIVMRTTEAPAGRSPRARGGGVRSAARRSVRAAPQGRVRPPGPAELPDARGRIWARGRRCSRRSAVSSHPSARRIRSAARDAVSLGRIGLADVPPAHDRRRCPRLLAGTPAPPPAHRAAGRSPAAPARPRCGRAVVLVAAGKGRVARLSRHQPPSTTPAPGVAYVPLRGRENNRPATAWCGGPDARQRRGAGLRHGAAREVARTVARSRLPGPRCRGPRPPPTGRPRPPAPTPAPI